MAGRYRNPLVVLFIGSGAAALIYEIVWFQLLQLVIGSSAVSVAVLVGTFMGGMCLGSLATPRLMSRDLHPLRVYAFLEFGIAAIGILVLSVLPFLASLYTALGGYGPRGIFLRALVCAVTLLPPTFLMGATLPAAARWAEATRTGVSSLGLLYAGNILGAVFGCLFAGFYLLRVYDTHLATYAAAGINVAVGSIALLMARSGGIAAAPNDDALPVASKPARSRPVYVATALSGLTALGAEVLWTRLMALILGASVYSFSIVLAVFLLGLGIGSSTASMLTKRFTQVRLALGMCQLLVVPAIAWAVYLQTQVLPFQEIDLAISQNPWLNFQVDLLRAAAAVLPAALLWGASFPLALAAAAEPGGDTGRLVGGLYAANTLGAIAGSVGFTLIFAVQLGSRHAHQMLMAIAGGSALLLLWPRVIPSVMAVLVVVAAAFVAQPVPDSLVGYGRFTAQTLGKLDPVTLEHFTPNFLYVGEGLHAFVAVSQASTGHRNFHVSGKIEASTEPQDMRLQRMLGYLPALVHSGPRSVLIVGFGAGVTAGTFVNLPGIERIVICEIEPLIPQAVATYFAAQNYDILKDPRVEIIYDDARHYLRTTDERFDVITSDPVHPWVKGAATLYTREYIDLVRRHLRPGGMVSQWVPLYQTSVEAVKSELATFFEVFPNGTVWGNDISGRGYDTVLLGRDDMNPIDLDGLDERLSRSEYAKVNRSLEDVGFASVTDVLATYAASAHDLGNWLADAEINRDRNLKLQYLAGMGVNLGQDNSIYHVILEHFQPPNIFLARSEQRIADLTRAITARRPRNLSRDQANAIASALKSGAPRLMTIGSIAGDQEAFHYAMRLRQAIIEGGWQVDAVSQSLLSDLVVGMLIRVGADPPPAHANELFRALRAAGLSVSGHLDPAADPQSVFLLVGEKQ